MNGQNLVGWCIFFLYGILLPAAAGCLHWRHPEWFRSWRLLFWICGSAIFSWSLVNAVILVPYFLGLYVPRGPELVFALFFGWLYLWVAALPVLSIYAVMHLVRLNMRKNHS